jgi:hypothetical protein
MRDASQGGVRSQRGLEAARKRLWPGTHRAAGANAAGCDPAAPPDVPARPRPEALGCTVRSHRGALALSAGALAAALLTAVGAPGAREDADPGWSIPPLENLTVRGAIRIVDEHGNVVALFGNVPGEGGSETLALELRSADGGQGAAVRLESLESGAALALRTPDRHSAMTLVSGDAGPYLLLAQGSRQRVIGPETADALPAVGARDAERALDLTDRRAQPLGEGLSAVDLRVARGQLRGRILNTSSVRHTGVEVELALGDHKLALQVPVISPGNSTGFGVAVPAGLPEPLLRSARVARVTSTLHYDARQPASESTRTR